jgi:hypothetical protein
MPKTMHRVGLVCASLWITGACGGGDDDDGQGTVAAGSSSSSGDDDSTSTATSASAGEPTTTETTADQGGSEADTAGESSSDGSDGSSSDGGGSDTGAAADPNYPPSDQGPCPPGYTSSPSIGNVCLAPCMAADDPIEACVQPLTGTGPAACGLVSMMSSLDPCETLGEPCENGEVCMLIDDMPDPVCSAVPDFCGIICSLAMMQFDCPDGMQCNDSNGLCVYP